MTNEIFESYGKDPIALFKQWFAEAQESEPNDPEAVCLATVSPDGQPRARMVLLKDISEEGFKFHTNEDSFKGQDITANERVGFCMYWKSIRKQIRVEGRAEQISDTEANEYFTTRPIERQIGAWASKQSSAFEKREDLESAVERYRGEFSGDDNIPRPPYWKGYRIIPDSIEFWIASETRLHTRFIYKRTTDEEWDAVWLCP